MKTRFAFLFGSAILFATMSTWCDSIAYPVSPETSRNTLHRIQTNAVQGPAAFDLANAKTLLRFPSAEPVRSTFETKWGFYIPSVRPGFGSQVFFAPEADIAAHDDAQDLIDFRDRTSSFEHLDEESRGARRRSVDANSGSANDPPVSAPEPGSLPFSLIGVIGVGLLVRRRRMHKMSPRPTLFPQSE
jgi:hypothetical protein